MSDPTANTPSEAVAMELCPMCLGHGTVHKFVPVEGLGECPGCAGGKTLEAFWAHQDAEADMMLDPVEPLPELPVVYSDDMEITGPRPADFAHDEVRLRVPAGTDPLLAVREAMGVFMERTDGSSALPWWSQRRWWHGSHDGFRRGDQLLPPAVTGVMPGLDGSDTDAVYLTSSRDDALMYSARHERPMLYEVTRIGTEPVHDDLLPADGDSWKVPSAVVYRIEQPSMLELRRVLYELQAPPSA